MRMTSCIGGTGIASLGVCALALAASAAALAGPDGWPNCCNKPENKVTTLNDGEAKAERTNAFKILDEPEALQKQEESTFRVITKSQDGAGEGHQVMLSRKIVNGQEQIELKIDGKEYQVDSMDEANAILREHGVDSMFKMDFGFGDDRGDMKFFGGPNDDRITVLPLQKRDEDANELTYQANQHPKAMLGVSLGPVNPAVRDYLGLKGGVGVMIGGVIPETPAAAAGLEANDIVTAVVVDGKRTNVDENSFRKIVGEREPGDEIELRIIRAGQVIEKRVELVKWDGETLGGQFGQQPAIVRRMKPGQFDVFPRGIDRDDFMKLFHEMEKQMPGMRFRIDPDDQLFRWEEKGIDHEDQEFEHGNGNGEDHDFFKDEPDFERMMQMMEQRMRRFEEQIQEMLQRQERMQRQMNRKKETNKDVDA